ncbi:MAG: hypothetical protein KTR18_01195 [Acidiferrobacterales bacterium]|nr:hypothetical protein [Acidiferrobacterales bacterium]
MSFRKILVLSLVFASTWCVSAFADYDDGYQWATINQPKDFSDCAKMFGTSEEEDGCNDYVQEMLFGDRKTYGPNNCDEGCNGYEAGYRWAEENGIADEYACESKNPSFVEGCQQFARDRS